MEDPHLVIQHTEDLVVQEVEVLVELLLEIQEVESVDKEMQVVLVKTCLQVLALVLVEVVQEQLVLMHQDQQVETVEQD